MNNLTVSVPQIPQPVKRNSGLDNHDSPRDPDGKFRYRGLQAAGGKKRFARQMDKERQAKERRPEAVALQLQYGFGADDCVFL